MQKYIVIYKHGGEEFMLQLPADSFSDAEQRLKSLCNGTILGEEITTFPVRKKPAPKPNLSVVRNS